MLTEEAKIFYFMNNLNDSIFMELSTRVLFPETYDEIKQRVIAEYSEKTTDRAQGNQGRGRQALWRGELHG